MSAGSNLTPEDQFLCSICLDVFTDPVSTPCGHNFCQSCISHYWDVHDSCQCPICKKMFSTRPEIEVNTLIRNILTETMEKLPGAELRRVQQYEVDVTIDPDTAHPIVVVSDDGKRVSLGSVYKNVPDNPKRFTRGTCVLGEQSFSSGRFYFEAQVEGKTAWALGVVRESYDRKGPIKLIPQDGCWSVWLRNNQYQALTGSPVRLSLSPPPEKVGVFVDYEEGLVSFYDVDAAALIYSFTGCCFTDKLHPFICPGPNDDGTNPAPLIICPVN